MGYPWFKNKSYGYGWYPATWQGWLVTLGFVAAVMYLFLGIDGRSHSATDTLLGFFPRLLVLIAAFFAVCLKTGERPEWRWAGKPFRKG